jgi:hypothetical protein
MPYALTLQELSGLYISLGSSLAYLAPRKWTQQVSSAELVFGTTLTLTEQFLASMEWLLANYIKQSYRLRPWPQFRTSC